MFIRIKDTNYFILIENKSPKDIYEEIFSRMNIQYISYKEKREIISSIKKQLNKTDE